MSLTAKESCPICWLDFNSELVPVSISCGHSFCHTCVQSLRSCAICRKKIYGHHAKVKNYALISLLDKQSSITLPEMIERETQTDIMNIRTPSTSSRNRSIQTANSQSRTSKKSSISLRLTHNALGNMNGIGITVKNTN